MMTATHINTGAQLIPRRKPVIATIWVVVFNLPSFDAAITLPSAAANMRSPETENSLAKMISAAHALTLPSSTRPEVRPLPEFVCNRINQLTKPGYLLATARQVSVQPIS